MRYLVVGHSHIECLRLGWEMTSQKDASVRFLSVRSFLRHANHANPAGDSGDRYIPEEQMIGTFREAAAGMDAIVFCLQGNQHSIIGMIEIDPMPKAQRLVEAGVDTGLRYWLALFLPHCTGRTWLLPAPPPLESAQHIYARAGTFAKRLAENPLRNAHDRLELWRSQTRVTKALGFEFDIPLISLPTSVLTSKGFLAKDCYGKDATHANADYGMKVMAVVCDALREPTERGHAGSTVSRHPYSDLPDHQYWKHAVSRVAAGDVDPVVQPRFIISTVDKVATAGSCFAQHISKRLRTGGFQFLVTEQAAAGDDAENRGFYDFSARYGNIYTARQLLQLFDRAFGYFRPAEQVWARAEGGFCDPFRPRIEPAGFATADAVMKDMRSHFAAVRSMFKSLDVFVFTLGLTECWTSKLDGAAYPIAPGVAGGVFDSSKYELLNFGVAEVQADMASFLRKLRLINRNAKVLLTVSPVPLAATAEDRHVLVATTYSKSVLRVAAEEIVAANRHVAYFPSYEIITGPHAQGRYFAADRRSVTDAGVDHVMRVFMARMTAAGSAASSSFDDVPSAEAYAAMEAAAETACDEELYQRDELVSQPTG